ncbi:MAG: hypothetical protein KKA79_00990 [Nanoarchaeota archaeon]|nr:hypothetical protein [Nanoarchaeota archaeon]
MKDEYKGFKKTISKYPLSHQRKILSSLDDMVKKTYKTDIQKDLEKISSGPRLVTHIDTDGIVSAVMMCYVNPKKYKEIIFSDYKPINAGKLILLETDDVVDLPQPRNPIYNKGEPAKHEGKVIFEDARVNFWADHHETGLFEGGYLGNHIYDASSPSCASLLYNHLLPDFPRIKRFQKLVEGTDIVDAARYTTPEAPYDMKNHAVVLRLMLIARSQRKLKLGFREELIRDCADHKKKWQDVINQPIVNALAKESITEMKKYREYITPMITNEHGVIMKVEEKRRPKGNGLKDRYYPNTLYPESLFFFDVQPAYGAKDCYMITMTENNLAKDKKGNHPSEIILGEEMKTIIKELTDSEDAGGHKGIGICTAVPKDNKDDVIKICKELLFKETKRLGC